MSTLKCLKRNHAANMNNIIVMGDLNGKVVNVNQGMERWIGTEKEMPICVGQRETKIEFFIENDLVIHTDIYEHIRKVNSREFIVYYNYFFSILNKIKNVEVKRWTRDRQRLLSTEDGNSGGSRIWVWGEPKYFL